MSSEPVGSFYAQEQPACPPQQPACPQPPVLSSGFSFSLPFSSRRVAGKPAYNVPCPEEVIYGAQPCAPQQVCEQIGGDMQAQNPSYEGQWQQQQPPQQYQQQQQQYPQGASATPQGEQPVQGHYDQRGYPQEQQQQHPQTLTAMGGQSSADTNKRIVLDLTHKDNRSTRSYLISIYGTLAQFAKNPKAAAWTLIDENILKRKIESAVGAKRHGNLEKTVILDARLHWTRSSAPKTVISQCSAFRGNAYTNTGQRGFCVVPPGKVTYAGADGKGKRVMRPPLIVGSALMSTYGHMDAESLRSPLTPVKGTRFTMVPRTHPIISIIALNTKKLGLSMEEYSQACGNQFPVVNELVESCLGQIEKQVHSHMPWSDMRQGKFTVSIEPADSVGGANNWDSLDGIDGIGRGFTSNETIARVLNTPFSVQMFITLVYAIADSKFATNA